MNLMGIRVKPNEVIVAIINTSESTVKNIENVKIPSAMPLPDALKYVRNSIIDIIKEYEIKRAGIRITESNSRTRNIRRISLEGVIQESFASSELERYYCGQISNITAKINTTRTDFKEFVDGKKSFDSISGWSKLNKEKREAVLVALGAENA